MKRSTALLLILLGLATPLHAQQPAFTRFEPTPAELDASLRVDWYGVYLQGQKVGYFRMGRERTDEGIVESNFTQVKLVAQGQKVEMNIGQTLLFEAKAPYALVKAAFKQSAGAVVTEFLMTRTGPGAFDVVHTVGGNIRKKAVAGLDFDLADALTTELWIKRGPEKDSEIVVREFDASEQLVDAQTRKILSRKTSLVAGVKTTYYEVESTSARVKIPVLSRHDDQGRILSGKVAVFELRSEPEALAKNTSFSIDLFVLGQVKVAFRLGDLRRVEELVLEVDGPGSAFADGPRQSLAKSNDGKSLLRLGKRYGKESKATLEEYSDNLKETSAYDVNHPRVKALAAQAVGNATTAADKVKNITKFVGDYIRGSRESSSLPTIHDIIDRKQGDCKSYALLFTNLARASGVPTREVVGLLYIGDDGQAFGGHAWNEVILNGVWVPIDATLNETEINATHLSFGTDKTAAKNLLESMGNLKLRVVEMRTR